MEVVEDCQTACGEDNSENDNSNLETIVGAVISLVDVGNKPVSNWLNCSPVLNTVTVAIIEFVCSSLHLRLELIKMLLLDWVDRLQNIPVYTSGARRSGQRSLIGPSFSHIDHHHKISKVDIRRSLITAFVPLERIEETVNNILLSFSNLDVESVSREQDTYSSSINFLSDI